MFTFFMKGTPVVPYSTAHLNDNHASTHSIGCDCYLDDCRVKNTFLTLKCT